MADLLGSIAPILIAALLLAAIMKLGTWLKARMQLDANGSRSSGDTEEDVMPTRRRSARSPSDLAAKTHGFGKGPASASTPTEGASAPVPVPLPTSREEMAAFAQASAKAGDDQHKAEIRAHVERANAPLTEADHAAKARAAGAMLAIKHIFPPCLPQRSFSFLGGQPIIPDSFDWPVIHNRKGLLEPLHFMAQIDCNSLPDGPGRDLLPADGYLYFFAPMAGNHGAEAWHFVTRYLPGRATSRWTPQQTGFMPPVDGAENAAHKFPWMCWRDKPSFPTHYPRTEIELGWIDANEEIAAGDPGTESAFPWEVAEQRRRENLIAFHGEPGVHDPLLSYFGKPTEQLWIPFEGFPTNYHAVEIIVGFLQTHLKPERAELAKRLARLGEATDGEDAAATAERDRLTRIKAAYLDFDLRHSAILRRANIARDQQAKPPTPDDRAAFLMLLELLRANGLPEPLVDRGYSHKQLPAVLNDWLATAALHSAETAMSDADGAAAVPPAVVEVLRSRHNVLKDRFRNTGEVAQHHLFGKGDCIQTAAEDMAEEHILLLQLRYDDPVGWRMGDNGALQYWIRPADLAAKRFDRTVSTFECH